jgi:hypothetical protein
MIDRIADITVLGHGRNEADWSRTRTERGNGGLAETAGQAKDARTKQMKPAATERVLRKRLWTPALGGSKSLELSSAMAAFG